MSFEFDPVIHQPIRTKILAYLLSAGTSDFTTIKNSLSLTDGHMSTHMKQLVESEYVEMDKTFVDNKPKTTYRISKLGKKRFSAYVETLKSIIALK